ncbi:uncharacterized protein V1516DRAFT_678572 [Lipomyces oligophaga]|uniref:uncharacterized protein n=1 Tax=Lipomyces oligophaga TaxID=45792 RepID=UPI0034CEB8D6
MESISSLIVILASLFIPPLGILFISGCSVDFVVNIALTMLGYLPGLLHALYLEYVYYSRREDADNGVINYDRAPGVYSDIIQRGGLPAGSFLFPQFANGQRVDLESGNSNFHDQVSDQDQVQSQAPEPMQSQNQDQSHAPYSDTPAVNSASKTDLRQ